MKDEDTWRFFNVTTTAKSEASSISSQHFGIGTEPRTFFRSTAPPPGFVALKGRIQGSDGSSSLSSSDDDQAAPLDLNGILDHIGLNDKDHTAAADDFCRQCTMGLSPGIDVARDPFRPMERGVSRFFHSPSCSSSSSSVITKTQTPRWEPHYTRLPPTHTELMSRIYRSSHELPMEQSTMAGWGSFPGSITEQNNSMEQRFREWNLLSQNFPPLPKTGTANGRVDLGQVCIATQWPPQQHGVSSDQQKPGPSPFAKPHLCPPYRQWSLQDCSFEPKPRPMTYAKVDLGESSSPWMHHHHHYGQKTAPLSSKQEFGHWDEPWIQQQRNFLLGQKRGQATAINSEMEQDREWIQQQQQNLIFGQKAGPPSSNPTETGQPQMFCELQHVQRSSDKPDVDHVYDEGRWQQNFQREQQQNEESLPSVIEPQTNVKTNQSDGTSPPEEDPVAEPTRVVCKEFARNWLQADRGPRDYVTYPTSPVQMMHRVIIFYVSSKQLDLGFQMVNFYVSAIHPEKSIVAVRVAKDRNKPRSRLICTFWAEHTGIHEVTVLYNNLEVDGSPFPINVTQDKAGEVPEENVVVSGLSPNVFRGTFTLPCSKLWGVVFNPTTKEVYAADRHGAEILIFSIRNDELALSSKWVLPVDFHLTESFHPTGIALDVIHQRAFVTDKGNHCIVVFSCTGRYLTHYGKPGFLDGEFSYPWGIAVTPDGEILAVADSKNHRIQLLTTSGHFIRRYSIFESNPYEFRKLFDQPRGVSFDASGTRLFVTDFNLAKTFEFDLNFTSRSAFGPSGITVRPQGISLDPSNGSYLICDSRQNLIRQLSSTGQLLRTIDGTFNDDFGLGMPIGACFCDRALCIVDRGGMRIRLIKCPDVNETPVQ